MLRLKLLSCAILASILFATNEVYSGDGCDGQPPSESGVNHLAQLACNVNKQVRDCSSLKPMTADQKLNPLGAHLVNLYYRSKFDDYPVYNVNNPKDLLVLLPRIPVDQKVGFNVVCGGRHRTPVVVKGNKALVLESLGVEKSRVGKNSVAQIVLAMSQMKNRNFQFTVPNANRQVDAVSCGVDANMVLKESVKHHLSLFEEFEESRKNGKEAEFSFDHIIDRNEQNDEFFKNARPVKVRTVDLTPTYIAKYTQSMSAVCQLPNKHGRIKKSNDAGAQDETVMEYALRNQRMTSFVLKSRDGSNEKRKVFLRDVSADLEISLQSLKMTTMNSAVEYRRNKFDRITKAMLKALTCDEIEEAIYQSSGLKLLMNGRPLENVSDSEAVKALVRKFLDQQMMMNRDQSQGEADPNQVSLLQIVQAMRN